MQQQKPIIIPQNMSTLDKINITYSPGEQEINIAQRMERLKISRIENNSANFQTWKEEKIIIRYNKKKHKQEMIISKLMLNEITNVVILAVSISKNQENNLYTELHCISYLNQFNQSDQSSGIRVPSFINTIDSSCSYLTVIKTMEIAKFLLKDLYATQNISTQNEMNIDLG
ncbi:hypothetical protein ABPG74_013452 [Tetrahymena malaccensis]